MSATNSKRKHIFRWCGDYIDSMCSDYNGASATGMKALLTRRSGQEGDGEHKETSEDLSSVAVVSSLKEVIEWVK
jgi:hypothetical protein